MQLLHIHIYIFILVLYANFANTHIYMYVSIFVFVYVYICYFRSQIKKKESSVKLYELNSLVFAFEAQIIKTMKLNI
jgi:hypothetical protein